VSVGFGEGFERELEQCWDPAECRNQTDQQQECWLKDWMIGAAILIGFAALFAAVYLTNEGLRQTIWTVIDHIADALS
jgi:hypothetical protein